jgi:hypothetical protein
MKKLIFLSLVLLTSVMCVSAQDPAMAGPRQFTKAELFAFADVKAIMSALNNGKDYSTYTVRSFTLGEYKVDQGAFIMEVAPGGVFSEQQKKIIENAKPGTKFAIAARLVESGKKSSLIEEPALSFTIKE